MDILPMVHFAFLAAWVGIVATEGVIELAPRFKRELHRPAMVFHYWIDLLVELPVILGIVSTGIALCFFIEKITALHIIKIALAGGAVACNLFCIFIVVKRQRIPASATEEGAWRESRKILLSFAVGCPMAVGALLIGIRLAVQRMAGTM